MHDKIKALKKENNELRKRIGNLEQDEEDLIEEETAEHERQNEEHEAEKKSMKDDISRTKVELDKLMSTKLII